MPEQTTLREPENYWLILGPGSRVLCSDVNKSWGGCGPGGRSCDRSWISDTLVKTWDSSSRQMCTRGSLWPQISLGPEETVSPSCGFFSEWWSCNLQVWAARRAARIRWCLQVFLMHWFHPRVDPAHRDSSRICEDVEDMIFCRSQWGTLFGDCSTDAGVCTLVNNWWCFYTWSCDGPAEK